MKTVGLPLYDLDLVINAFEFAGMDRIIAVVDNSIPMPFEHLRKGS